MGDILKCLFSQKGEAFRGYLQNLGTIESRSLDMRFRQQAIFGGIRCHGKHILVFEISHSRTLHGPGDYF